MLRAKNDSHRSGAGLLGLEKPPPKWGGVCEPGGVGGLVSCGRETPTEVGRSLQRSLHCRAGMVFPEKPPPEWGGVCELGHLLECCYPC